MNPMDEETESVYMVEILEMRKSLLEFSDRITSLEADLEVRSDYWTIHRELGEIRGRIHTTLVALQQTQSVDLAATMLLELLTPPPAPRCQHDLLPEECEVCKAVLAP
jgi:phosphomevalonate kinase